MKNNVNMNYDNTKKMLNTLRNLNESTIKKMTLREQEEDSQEKEMKDNVTVVAGVEVRLIASSEEDLELSEVTKKTIEDVIANFGMEVSDLGDLRPGITIQPDQIRMDGNLPDVGLNFVLIAGKDMGVYLNTSMLKVSYELMEVIEKLSKFEEIFTDAMNDLISQRRID